MLHSPYAYILLIALVTYLLRALPLTLIRKPIRSVFVRSFLFYVPYVTLSVMTFPAILNAAGSKAAGLIAFAAAMALALGRRGLLTVSLGACAAAFVAGLLI